MPPVQHLFSRIFIAGFYKVHAGIFLFFFLVLFGAVEPSQMINYQENLALAVIGSPMLISIVMAAWLVYCLKTTQYILAETGKPEQHFLQYSFTSLPAGLQFRNWLLVQASLLIPVAVYALPMCWLAIREQKVMIAGFILLYFILLLVAGACFFTVYTSRLIHSSKSKWLSLLTRRLPKPLWSFYLLNLAENQKVAFAVTKVFSYLLVTALFWMFHDVAADLRVALIVVLAIAAAHSGIIQQNYDFGASRLKFSRNLPLAMWSRFSALFLIYVAILLPEMIWMLSRFTLFQALNLSLFLLGIVLFFHSLLYFRFVNDENYFLLVFTFFILIFLLILFNFGSLTGAVLLLLAYFINQTNYYRN